jgi:hypothetical protein
MCSVSPAPITPILLTQQEMDYFNRLTPRLLATHARILEQEGAENAEELLTER